MTQHGAEPLYWYSVCAVVLFAKMLAISLYQAYHRIGKLTFKNEDDARFARRVAAPEELPQVRRAAQAWGNDLENIPIFLALGLAYVLAGASPSAAPGYFLTFTAARILHTVFYLGHIQPWRTLVYGVGIACLIGMSVNLLKAVG